MRRPCRAYSPYDQQYGLRPESNPYALKRGRDGVEQYLGALERDGYRRALARQEFGWTVAACFRAHQFSRCSFPHNGHNDVVWLIFVSGFHSRSDNRYEDQHDVWRFHAKCGESGMSRDESSLER